MARNSKKYDVKYYKNNERRRAQMRTVMQNRRALLKGFNLPLARRLYGELIARGVCQCDARWAVLDAVGRGRFECAR